MTFPQNTAWGHLGIRNPAQFALMNAATYAGQVVLVDDGAQLLEYRSDGANWVSNFTKAKTDSLSALASGAGTITTADLATTTGTMGQIVRLSDGDDEGAVLMWSSTTNNPTPSWRWWLWPDAEYA